MIDNNENKIVEISDVKYNFNLNVFEGPLDVLLYLARTNKIEITDISLDELIDQYITYIESVQDQGINVASEYIVMAAELIKIKSKTLLPGQPLEELEEMLDGTYTREQLIEKLVEYKKYKDVSEQLEVLHANRPKTYYRSKSQMKELRDINFKESVDIDRLKLAMQSVLLATESTVQETRTIETKELDIESKVEYFKTMKDNQKFRQLITNTDRIERVAILLGLLESVKLGHVHIKLEADDITIIPGESGECNEGE